MSITAARLDRIQPSLTIAISTVARRMIAEGKNVISLSQGEPDFDTPRNIKDAAIRAMEKGETKYTDVSGTPALRKAVAEKFRRDNGIDYKPEEIIISTGAKQVLFNAMVSTLNPGDEVIIPSPCWVSYPDIVTLADGKSILVPAARTMASSCVPRIWKRRSPRRPAGSCSTTLVTRPALPTVRTTSSRFARS